MSLQYWQYLKSMFLENGQAICSRYSHLILLLILIRPIIPTEVLEITYLEHILKVNLVQWTKSAKF